MKTEAIVARIAELQTVQKTNRPTTAEWQRASEELAAHYAEMAARQRDNGGELDWRNWRVYA